MYDLTMYGDLINEKYVELCYACMVYFLFLHNN